jgi:hypothetical protein
MVGACSGSAARHLAASRAAAARSPGTPAWGTCSGGREGAFSGRFAAREHFVQNRAEARHIGAQVDFPREAVGRKQRRASGAQRYRGRGYVAVRPANFVQLAQSGGHFRGAAQGKGQGQRPFRQSAGKGFLMHLAMATGYFRHILRPKLYPLAAPE